MFAVTPDEVLVGETDKPVKIEDASRLDLDDAISDVNLGGYNLEDLTDGEDKLRLQQQAVQQFSGSQAVLEEAISVMVAQQTPIAVGTNQTDVTRVDYFPVPSSGPQIPLQVNSYL